jgi:hypothetical protein
MAKKKKEVNKSQAVRDYAKAHPAATNKEISAALRKRGIPLAASRISYLRTNTSSHWAMMVVVKKVAASRGVGLPEIRVAMSLVSLMGGVEQANRALMAAKKVIASGGVGSPEVRLASGLIEMTGGVEGAKVALAAAQKIRAMV